MNHLLARAAITLVVMLILSASYMLISDISKKKEIKDFRIGSYLLMSNVEKYLVSTLTHKTDCEISNQLNVNDIHTSYQRFKKSCDFIWAEADVIHRKFNKNKNEMAGVAIFESSTAFRYYPIYKNEQDDNKLSMIGDYAVKSYDYTIEKNEIHYINNSLLKNGFY